MHQYEELKINFYDSLIFMQLHRYINWLLIKPQNVGLKPSDKPLDLKHIILQLVC